MQVLKKLQEDLKNDFLAGLLVVIPLATTIWLSYVIATWAIDLLTRIPKQLNPLDNLHPVLLNLINFCIGLTVPLVFILSIGLMARNIVGQWLLHLGERIVQAIPLAGAVYKTVKQILETIFQDTENKFRRVVLVEYPRKGIWSIGFVTGRVSDAIGKNFDKPLLSVFIPTTPNPTTGWYAIVAEEEVITLDMSIEDAFKILLSGGIVNPNNGNSNPPPTINNGYKENTSFLVKTPPPQSILGDPFYKKPPICYNKCKEILRKTWDLPPPHFLKIKRQQTICRRLSPMARMASVFFL